MTWIAEIMCNRGGQSVRSLHRMGSDFPSVLPGRQTPEHCLGNRPRPYNLDRTNSAPSTMAFIFANATFLGKYFRPQSGATIRRPGLTNGRARRIRLATASEVSIS
jgi:hypothetical protein